MLYLHNRTTVSPFMLAMNNQNGGLNESFSALSVNDGNSNAIQRPPSAGGAQPTTTTTNGATQQRSTYVPPHLRNRQPRQNSTDSVNSARPESPAGSVSSQRAYDRPPSSASDR